MTTRQDNKEKTEQKKKVNKTWAAILAHQGDIQIIQKGLFL
jgi:hypothetical protein